MRMDATYIDVSSIPTNNISPKSGRFFIVTKGNGSSEIIRMFINDRIRKDFGDIDELAKNIKENSLLNPITVMAKKDGTYLLLAGERRLRACKKLGYTTIDVNVVSAESAEKELMIEISENECRKEFTMTERLRFAEKLKEVEAEKARKRSLANLKQNTEVKNSSPRISKGKTRDIVAEQSGIGSFDTLRKATFISDNQSLLSPDDFANWDHNKLSTNKAYQKIVAEKKRIEEENERLRQDAEKLQ